RRFSVDASVREVYGALQAGATLIIPSADEAGDPRALVRLAQTSQASALFAVVPSLLRELTDAAERLDVRLGSLRMVLVSGEPLTAKDVQRIRAVTGQRTVIVNQYGPTECTMTSTRFFVPTGI